MLAGLTGGVGDMMFEALGRPDPHKMTPDPHEMRQKMDQAEFVRHADLKFIETRTYNLNDPDDRNQYNKDRQWLWVGASMNTHYLLHHEKRFVETTNPPGWIAHMEWAELQLTEQRVEPIASQEPANEAIAKLHSDRTAAAGE